MILIGGAVLLLAGGTFGVLQAIPHVSQPKFTNDRSHLPEPTSDGVGQSGGYRADAMPRALDLTNATKASFETDLSPASPDWPFAVREFPPNENPNQSIGSFAVDLNGDGAPEQAYYVIGSATCGAGNCDLRIYQDGDGTRKQIAGMATGPLFYVLPSTTNGYRDLAFPNMRPGIEANSFVVWRWNPTK